VNGQRGPSFRARGESTQARIPHLLTAGWLEGFGGGCGTWGGRKKDEGFVRMGRVTIRIRACTTLAQIPLRKKKQPKI